MKDRFDLTLKETWLPGREEAKAEVDSGEDGGGEEVDPFRVTGWANKG